MYKPTQIKFLGKCCWPVLSHKPVELFLGSYCHGDSDIKRLCAGLPLLEYVPALIIVDDFMDFMPGSVKGAGG